MHGAALGAGQADVSQTRSASLRTRVKDVVTWFAQCVFDTAALARAANQPHTLEETYTIAMGHVYRPGHPMIPCVLECGKQLPEDRKALFFVGTTGTLRLDLLANTLTLSSRVSPGKEVFRQWHPRWSYARLILQTLAWLGSMPGRYPPVGCS